MSKPQQGMLTYTQNRTLEFVIRWIVGASFIWASIHKISDPAQFAKIIYGYYLFPEISINLIAIFLPFVELVCGLALCAGIYPRGAALLINIMLLAFIIAISINFVRGHEFDCGCFSFGQGGYLHSAAQLLVRDIVYFILGLHIFFYKQSRKWCLKQAGGLKA